jgi:hypothetical protein
MIVETNLATAAGWSIPISETGEFKAECLGKN